MSFSDAATNLRTLTDPRHLPRLRSHLRKVVTVRDGAITTSGNTNTDESSAFHRQQQQRKRLPSRLATVAFTARLQSLHRFSNYHALEYSSRFARAQRKTTASWVYESATWNVILIIMCVCIINAVSGMYTLLRVFVLSSLSSHFSFCVLFLPSNPSFITRTFNTTNYYRKENGAIIILASSSVALSFPFCPLFRFRV